MKQVIKTIVLCIPLTIAACGGGGGNSDSGSAPSDTTPNSFTFTDQTGVTLNTIFVSNSIAVSGIDSGAAISITGGEYSVDGAAFTSSAGTVNNGQSIVVRQISSGTSLTKKDALLTIGGVSDTYSVTTLNDTTSPTVNVIFPPIKSLSYGDTVTMRGTATDDDSSVITSLKVNGVAASTTDGFANWTVTVPLTNGNNNLVVDVTDFNSNNDPSASSVNVLRTDTMLGNPTGIALDALNNRILLADIDTDSVTAVDLTTGTRSILSNSKTSFVGGLDRSFFNPSDVVVDTPRNRALVADLGTSDIIAVDLTTGNKSFPFPLDSPEVGVPIDLEIDPINNRVFAIYSRTNIVVSYDLVTGVRTVISDDTNLSAPITSPDAIAFDSNNNRLLVGDNPNGNDAASQIIAVDITTGNRTIFSNSTTPVSGGPDFNGVKDIVIDGSIAYVASVSSIIAVQLSDGSRSLISGPSFPNSNLPMFTGVLGLEIDKTNNRLLVAGTPGPSTVQGIAEGAKSAVIAVDLSPSNLGYRSVISEDINVLSTDPNHKQAGVMGIAFDSINNRLLTAERLPRISSIDPTTGDANILSESGVLDYYYISKNNNFWLWTLDLDIDVANNRAIVIDLDSSRMIAVNLTDGSRTPFAVNSPSQLFYEFRNIEIDNVHNRAFFVNVATQQLLSVDLTTEVITVISDNVLHSGVVIETPYDSCLDLANNRVFVVDRGVTSGISKIKVVDLNDGSRSALVTTGTEDTTLITLEDIVLDEANNRLLVSDITRNMIIAIDLTTLERSVISSGIFPNSHNAFSNATKIVIDPTEPTRAWVSEVGQKAVMMLDLITGERIYFSR